jgi:hypothetical protein
LEEIFLAYYEADRRANQHGGQEGK